jgi:RimJ/RimL family protein N-acetyltransferase
VPSIAPRTHPLRNGGEFVIREATREDAAELLVHVEAVSGESPFLTFGPGEFEMTVAQEADFLAKCQATPNALYLIGLVDGEIVASSATMGSARSRLRHRVELAMSVRQAYWRQGIGGAMLDALMTWARASPVVTKLDLRVNTTNVGAVALYLRKGFHKEGTLRKQMMVDGVAQDLFYMGLDVA